MGSDFTLEEKTFQGYELARIEGKISVEYQTEPQVTTFIYTPKESQSSAKESGRVQVTYVDEKDAQLADPVTLEGDVDAKLIQLRRKKFQATTSCEWRVQLLAPSRQKSKT